MSTPSISNNNSQNTEPYTSPEGIKILEKLSIAKTARTAQACHVGTIDLRQELLKASRKCNYTQIISEIQAINMDDFLNTDDRTELTSVRNRIEEICNRFLMTQDAEAEKAAYAQQKLLEPQKPILQKEEKTQPLKKLNIASQQNSQPPSSNGAKPAPKKLNLQMNASTIVSGLQKSLETKNIMSGLMKGKIKAQLEASPEFNALPEKDKTTALEASNKAEKEVYSKVKAHLESHSKLNEEDSLEFETIMYYYESTMTAYRMQLDLVNTYYTSLKSDLKNKFNIDPNIDINTQLKEINIKINPNNDHYKSLNEYHSTYNQAKYLRATIVSLNYFSKVFDDTTALKFAVDSATATQYNKYMGEGWYQNAQSEFLSIRDQIHQVNGEAWGVTGEKGGALPQSRHAYARII